MHRDYTGNTIGKHRIAIARRFRAQRFGIVPTNRVTDRDHHRCGKAAPCGRPFSLSCLFYSHNDLVHLRNGAGKKYRGMHLAMKKIQRDETDAFES